MSTTRILPQDADKADYVHFGDVARDRCGMQCQYVSRYLAGDLNTVALGLDLRWVGSTADYHGLKIHKDDADVFVACLREHRISHGCGWSGEKGGS